jgi:murein DD-endopeptidase MepM/ murein hydrolase activator NlpD
VFFAAAYAVLHGWLPVPQAWRQLCAYYLTSPAADWSPRLAAYLNLDISERYGYAPATAFPERTPDTKAPAAASTLGSPLEGKVIRPFGEVVSPVDGRRLSHPGIDLVAAPGQPVKAALAGRVKRISEEDGALVVELEHPEGVCTVYARLASVEVEEGQEVMAGQELGRVLGGWLHFEVSRAGQPVDPLPWLATASNGS